MLVVGGFPIAPVSRLKYWNQEQAVKSQYIGNGTFAAQKTHLGDQLGLKNVVTDNRVKHSSSSTEDDLSLSSITAFFREFWHASGGTAEITIDFHGCRSHRW